MNSFKVSRNIVAKVTQIAVIYPENSRLIVHSNTAEHLIEGFNWIKGSHVKNTNWMHFIRNALREPAIKSILHSSSNRLIQLFCQNRINWTKWLRNLIFILIVSGIMMRFFVPGICKETTSRSCWKRISKAWETWGYCKSELSFLIP